MAIRFTSFIKHNENDYKLYIIQQNTDLQKPFFHIYLRDGETVEFSLVQENNDTWKILPHNVPDWVKELQPILSSIIERQLMKETRKPVTSGDRMM